MSQQSPDAKGGDNARQCRTREINTQFSGCLTAAGKCHCNFAFLLVDGYLCTHPDHRAFR